MKSLPEATRMKSVAKTRKKSTGLADYTSASRFLRLFYRGNKCVFPFLPFCHGVCGYGDAKPEQKDKEDLEEITTELELADEDELVPYALSLYLPFCLFGSLADNDRYKIGDTFFQLPLAEAQALLATSTEEAEGEVTKLEESMSDLREELQQLKVALYARFGRGINLEA